MKNIKDLKVVFMGTPDFAVGTLEALVQAGHEVVPIVSIEKISYNDSVYGLFLEDTTELLSNGFVIGEDETAKLQAEKDYLEKELEIILKRKQEVDEKLKKMQCE